MNINLILKKIQTQISNNPIILYMKGSPHSPSCGFSSQTVKVLSKCIKSFAYIDVLEHPDIRSELPKFSSWPTYPQLWIDAELIGGCDIIVDMFRRHELQKLIKKIKLKYNIQEGDNWKCNNAYIE